MTTDLAPAPITVDAERADLLAELAAARSFLRGTTEGLTDEQAGARTTVSELCLGGLVKHVTAVEESWTRFVLEGPSADEYALPDGVTWDDLMAGTARELPAWAVRREQEFRMMPGDTLAGVLARYAEAAAATDRVLVELPDLSVAHPLPEAPWNEPGGVRSARRVFLHIVAETSQHAGHADILREAIDGRKSMG